MVQEDCGGVAALIGYSRQRSVDPSHYPMCSGVDEEETRTHDFSSHPGTFSRHSCFRSYLKRIGVYDSAECPKCSETDEDVGHVLFVCPDFWKKEKRLGPYRKAP